MPDMTEEEYDALGELWTKNPPKVSGDGKNGFFMKHKNEIVILDNVSAAWLRLKSEITQLTYNFNLKLPYRWFTAILN